MASTHPSRCGQQDAATAEQTSDNRACDVQVLDLLSDACDGLLETAVRDHKLLA